MYVARPGDTIWSVAVRYDRGEDPRPLADLLEAQIGGAVLQPGQRLMVPKAAARALIWPRHTAAGGWR